MSRKSLNFTKYSGAGNDFIIVDARDEPALNDGAPVARALCRRGTAVGADGLVLLQLEDLDEGVHGRMRLWNADGTQAEFSGNAARCAVRFLADAGVATETVKLQTDVGLVTGQVDGRNVRVTVPGGGAVWPQRRLRVEGRDLVGTYVVVGVPFFVLLHDDPDELPVRFLGRAIRNHPDLAPAGANVDFVRIDDEQELYFRVYERGVEAETLSSGTGSIAAALAAAVADRAASPVACRAQGGTLMVRFRPRPQAPARENVANVPEPEPQPTDERAAAAAEAQDAAEPETPERPRVAEGDPVEFIDIEVEGDTRRVMTGTAAADALRIR